MDEDEEEGLRAFALEVGCHSSAAYADQPLWVAHDGQRLNIAAIDARWREEERLGFRIRFEDGTAMVLYYVPELDIWSGAPPSKAGRFPPRSPRRNDEHR
jgi:hypothetical protein